MKKANKIFNIGFNKSGSTSLTKAMEILGYRAIHYKHDDVMLVDVIEANIKNGNKLLAGLEQYDFFSDFSGRPFLKELDKQYPGSKFILTIRELNAWLESREKHVKRNQQNPNYKYNFLKVDKDEWKKSRESALLMLKKYFKNREKDFLIIDICAGDRWEKLCSFLSKPLPKEPFPFLNKKPIKADKLYEQLEKDFITPKLSDDWDSDIGDVADFVCQNFKKRSMGLVCDFTTEINSVYTAVFPEKIIMQKVIDSHARKALLFVHHPAIWDIRKAPKIFQPMNKKLLQQFKERRISIYNLHVPLDNYSEYSTSVSLAKALKIKPAKPFAPYFGALCGIFGKSAFLTVKELKEKFETTVGHKVSLYNYGDNKINKKAVAIVAGGGNEVEILKEVAKAGINTFITGVTVKNDHSREAHKFAKENKINILGGTHYSTEKFACMAMVDYFKKFDLPTEFIEGQPLMEDI